MGKKFKIWLDESGDFKDNNSEYYKNPSLVGGILCEYDNFGSDIVNSIIVEDFFHANENRDGKRNLEILQKIIDKKGQLVVFENTKKLNIVNSDITYINIFAEGIVKLIQHLISEHGQVEIEILKANRVNTIHKDNTGEIKIITDEEYTTRVKERITIGFIKSGINTSSIKWDFKLASARKDKRLMLSDCICNVYLTRTAKKFTEEYSEMLNDIISKYKVIKVLNDTEEDIIRKYLIQGNISNAIIDYVSDEEIFKDKLIEKLIINSIKDTNSEFLNAQMNILSNKLEEIVNYRRDFLVAEKILLRLKNSFIKILKENNISFGELEFYVLINLFSLYTHTGEVAKCKEIESEIKEYFKSKKNLNNEVIQQYFRFRNKIAVNYNNEFAFEKAIEMLTGNVKAIEDKMLSDSMIKDDILEGNSSEIKNIELGKSLGTMVQSRIFLSRFNKNELDKAREDSLMALEILSNTSGYSRQLQYRAILESEAGNFEEALNYFKKSITKPERDDITLEEVINILVNTNEINIFNLMHYCRLMGEAALKNHTIADQLYTELNKNISKLPILTDELSESSNKSHPMEVIYWKIATYYSCKGMYNAADRYYSKAVNVAINSNSSITRHIIGLAILCEKYHFISKAGKNFEKESKKTFLQVKKLINSIKEINESDSINSFIDENFGDYEKNPFEASRKLAY